MGTVSIWTKKTYIKPHEEKGKKVKHSTGLMDVNCIIKMRKLDSIAAYDMDGKELYSHSDNPEDWVTITPESIYEKLYNIVCNR